MQVNILEYDEEKEIVLEITGEGHTFSNVLRDFLCDTKDVDSAGYYKAHPFIEKTKIVIKASPKRKLDKAVRTACKDFTKAVDDLYRMIEKAAS